MPKLFDLLSERTNKDALQKIQRDAHASKQPEKIHKQHDHPPLKKPNPAEDYYLPDFVAVDVETTGLDAKKDRIMEIGAVKFKQGKPGEEFRTFIRPGVPIPQKIIDLTGITDEKVMQAPVFRDKAEELVRFIGHLPLCGHQIDFDYSFINEELKRAGRDLLRNKLLDTAVLSRILIADLAGYSLGLVCKHLGIDLVRAHRALDDARASGHIAVQLVPKIYDIPPRIRLIMGQFAPYSLVKLMLLKSVENIDLPVLPVESVSARNYERLSLPEEPVPVDRAVIERIFSDGGELSRVMSGYQPRPSQAKMAREVIDALNTHSFCIAEAGTGTGKSLAYLIPAAQWAFVNNCRVLVSTHTKNLQDQLVSNDLPIVESITGKGFTFAALKGRSNYLCRYRWGRFLAGELGNLSGRERLGILPLIRWAETTKSGDIEEQNQFNRRWFAKVWGMIAAESHGCLGRRCHSFSTCFLQNARQKALGSHIVVINHALFFSEVCADSSFLGKTGTIIFDEAHHLESCGHTYLRTEIDTHRVERYFEFMNDLVKVIEPALVVPEAVEVIKKYKNALKRLRKNGTQFLSDASIWANKELQANRQAANETHYQFAYRDKPLSGSSGLAGFNLVVKDLQDVLFSLQEHVSQQKEDTVLLRSDIAGRLEKTSQLKADLAYCTEACTDDHVFWVEGDSQKGWVKLCGVPLDVGGLLHSIWAQNTSALVFTSATLAISGSVDYFKRKAGLVGDLEARTCFSTFASPFSEDQTFRCALSTGRVPDTEGYDEYVADVIVRLLNRFDKNILVLFTANTMLYNVHTILINRPDFPENGVILTQGISGPRAALVDKLKESSRSVLLGAASFWEGIDAPGAACEIVIIPRLPFPVPSHPLTQALAEKIKMESGESFFSFSVPEAVIKFRQGAGRLIRTAHDRGVLLVLDGRIVGKPYGKVFVESIGGEVKTCGSIDGMIEEVADFF